MLEPVELAQLAARAHLRDHPPEAAATDAADPTAFLHAAVTEIEGLRTALDHARTTGQATGIIMERFGLDAETAFATLAQLSQDTNRKLYDLADNLTHQQRPPASVPEHQAPTRDTRRATDTGTGTQQTG